LVVQPVGPNVVAESIIDALPDAVAVVDAQGRILRGNRKLEEFVAGRAADSLLHLLGCGEPFSDLTKSGEPFTRRFNCDHRHLEVIAAPFHASGPDHWLCTIRDVTAEVRRREKLLAIHRAGRELSRLTPGELASMTVAERVNLLKANIIQYAKQILDFRNLEVRLLDSTTNRLTVLLSEGVPGGANKELYASEEGNGITGYVAATGKGHLVSDVRDDPRYLPGAVDAKSSLTAPILDGGKVIGTFNVESDRPHAFSAVDLDFLEVFCNEIAQAISTLELLKEQKRIGGSATIDSVLNEVGVPADAIVADTLLILERQSAPPNASNVSTSRISAEECVPMLGRILRNARAVKQGILKAAQSAEASDVLPAGAERLKGKRVLVVDADTQIRLLAHQLLLKLQCEADTAGDAREALGLLRSFTYDVVCVDVELSKLDGEDLFVRIHERFPLLPMVLLKGFGYDAGHRLVRARQMGLKVFLYKPFRIERLVESLEDALFRPGTREPASSAKPGRFALT
jgi:CheY-like chemotaxis protein/GAF domain-containing protein